MNGSPRSIGRSPGLSSPSARARPGGQHEVARQRRSRSSPAAPPPPARVIPGRSPRSRRRTPCRGLAAAHSKAASCSTSLMTRRPSRGVDQQVGRVLDEPGAADQPAHRVDEVRRQRRSSHRSAYVFQPTRPTRLPGADALVAEDLGERSRPIARLARQAEVLEPMTPHRQRRGAGHAPALVADEDGRVAVRPDDQQRLLEARVEAGQVRQVGAVLAVGVDDQPVVAARVQRARAAARAARRSCAAGISGMASGSPKSGSVDLGQRGARRRSWRSHPSGSTAEALGRAALDLGEPVRPTGRQARPRRPATCTRTSAPVAVPSPKWIQPELPADVAAADGQLALDDPLADAHLDPGADRRRGSAPSCSRRSADPVAHRLRRRRPSRSPRCARGRRSRDG